MVEKRFEKLGMPDIERFENYLPTAFNSELTLLQKVNKIIFDLIETNKLTNEMIDYLNKFIETFDEKLYKTIEDVLIVWLEDGRLADVVRATINEEVIESRDGFDRLNDRLNNFKENDILFWKEIEKTNNEVEKIKKYVINVKDYGAVGDGITDDTNSFKLAISEASKLMDNSVRQIKGATIYLPNGHYIIENEVLNVEVSGISLVGDSIGTTIQYNGQDCLFNFKSKDGFALYRVGLKNLTIYAPNTLIDKPLIKLTNIINSMFTDLVIEDTVDAIYTETLGKVFFNNIIFTQTKTVKQSRYAFDINDGSDVHFTDIQVFANGTSLTVGTFMAIRSGDGLYFNNCHFHGTLYISPKDNKTLASVFFNQCYFDKASAACIHFTGASTNPYRNFTFNGCYFREGGHGVNFSVTGTLELINFIGCFFTQHRLNGFIGGSNVSNVLISGCIFADNNATNSPNVGHINSNINNLTVTGCQFIRGSSNGFGVKLSGVGYLFRENSLYNCGGSDKLILEGSKYSVGSNQGVPSVARGSATINKNETEITVTHGLNNVSSEMIMVLPRSIITTQYRISWVDEFSFRIVLNVAPSSGNIIFTWWIDKDIQN